MPPSAMTLTYWPVSIRCCMRAPPASAIAVAWGTPTPMTCRVVHAAPGPDAHEHPHGAGAHQVEGGVVRGAAAHDDRHGQLGDEPLQVERLGHRGDVLGGDDGALDDQDVEARLERDVHVVGHALRRERPGGDHALVLDLLDPVGDQLGLDRLAVDLLETARGLLRGHRRDALQLGVRLLVAGLDALQVEHPRPPSLPMMPAVRVSTTPSIAEARSGSSKLCPSSRQVRSTSSGSRVRRLGTIAISSSP